MAEAIRECRPDSLYWGDLGARGEEDFVTRCRRDWDDVAAELTSRELELAIDACDQARDEVQDLDCDEVVAMYALDR